MLKFCLRFAHFGKILERFSFLQRKRSKTEAIMHTLGKALLLIVKIDQRNKREPLWEHAIWYMSLPRLAFALYSFIY